MSRRKTIEQLQEEYKILNISEYASLSPKELARTWKKNVNTKKGSSIIKTFVYRCFRTFGNLPFETFAHTLDDSEMDKWKQVFIHPSFDEKFNYEHYEAMGDPALTDAFINLLQDKYETQLTPQQFQLSRSYYMKGESQSELAEKLNLELMIISSGVVDMVKTTEDVFEAFFGAMSRILNAKHRGSGYEFIYFFLEHLLPRDFSVVDDKDAITQVKERFDLFTKYYPNIEKFEMIEEILEGSNGKEIKIYYVTPSLGRFAETAGKIENRRLLKLESGTKALLKMDELGYTEKRYIELKLLRDRQDEEFEKHHQQVMEIFSNIKEDIYSNHNKTDYPIGYKLNEQHNKNTYFVTMDLNWQISSQGENSIIVNEKVASGSSQNVLDAKINCLKNFIHEFKNIVPKK